MRTLITILFIPVILLAQAAEETIMFPDLNKEGLLLSYNEKPEKTIKLSEINADGSTKPVENAVKLLEQAAKEEMKTSDQATDQSIVFLGKSSEKLDKWLYIGAVTLTLFHKSIIDARIWEKSERPLPAWAKSDEVYLGGTALTVGLLAYTSYRYGKDASVWQFVKTTLASFLIGSEIWDLEFGHLVHGDAMYAFPKWYGNWGFKNKSERVAFDLGRVAAAAVLLIWDF